MNKKIGFLLVLICLVSGCATQMTPLQRRTIESRELEGKFEDAYKATLQVFQDYGYIIASSDHDSGVIHGETGIRQTLFSMVNTEITATIEQFGSNTVKERISIIKKFKSSSQYGTQESSQIVDDPQLFQKIYDDIQKEMFVRKNLSK